MAGVVAELVVRHREEQVLPYISNHIKLYNRYVDDILIITEKDKYIPDFTSRLSDPSLSLKLVKERHSETHINYLDLRIQIVAGEYDLSVFRKDTYVPLFINANAKEPWSYKMAAFRALLQSIKTHFSTSKSIEEELDWIKKQAVRNGSSKRIISSLWKKLNKRKVIKNDDLQDTDDRPTYSIDINDITLKFKKKLEKATGHRITYSRRNTLFNLLRNDKDKLNPNHIPGVHEIPLLDNDTNKTLKYIGYTRRSLNKRLPEHMRDLQNNVTTTALAQKALTNELQVNWNDAKVIHKEHDIKKGRIAELLTIYNKRNDLIKPINKLDPTSINNAWKWCSDRF